MTAALEDVVRKDAGKLSGEDRAAAELVRQAKEPGLSLTGPDVPPRSISIRLCLNHPHQ